MTKEEIKKAAATKVAAFDLEKFQKLSPEEQAEYVTSLHEDNATLKAEKEAIKAEAEKDLLPSFSIEETNEDLEVEQGDEFEFTAPLLTWDDNTIIDIKVLSKSEDKREQELYALICASLIQRKSGLIRRKEG